MNAPISTNDSPMTMRVAYPSNRFAKIAGADPQETVIRKMSGLEIGAVLTGFAVLGVWLLAQDSRGVK